jgi:ferric-dicitrate binding protein FerR (iron transport regulator)
MKLSPKMLRVAGCFVCVSLTLAQTSETKHASLSAGSASVQEVKGQVVITSPAGAPIPSQAGAVLAVGCHIATQKGTALLLLEDGSQVLVQPHSIVVLQSPASSGGSYLVELLGRILAKAQKRLGSNPSFRMGTPSAVISVRGTEFQVQVDKHGKTEVEVYEGLVEVQSIGGFGGPVFVAPSYGTEVLPNQPAEEPKPLPSPMAHSAGRGREDDRNAWPALAGSSARGYSGNSEADHSSRSSSQAAQKSTSEDNPDE